MKLNRLDFSPTRADYLKFAIPSLMGIVLFMVPFRYEGEVTILVAWLAKWAEGQFHAILPPFMTLVFIATVIVTAITKWLKPEAILNRPFLKGLFDVSYFWFIMRILGAVFAVLTLYEIGPAFIWSEDTGGLVLSDLVPVLAAIFVFAGLFLPLLLGFGLLELVGALMTKIMRPVFTLPGRSSIDCLTSWMGDGTIGVLLTSRQYEEGYYTKREAAVIATNFSVVSITFSLVVISFLDLGHLFVPFYLTVTLAGIVAAIVMPRTPPLSRKEDTYYEPVGKQINETIPEEISALRYGLLQATAKAAEVKSIGAVLKRGVQNILEMWIGVVPLVMALGTLALIIAEFTPLFVYLGYPFVTILSVLQVPAAAEAAQAMVVGFADMFLPAVIGTGIEDPMTRFIIACVSVTQLIYMSEVGVILLRSKLGLNLLDLMIIFLQRTLITLPVIVLMAHFIF
ncbi:nucleoside recognition membrane protein YjiH [Caldalkalibacillus uzonensis]|uniref:Nucleoside recognition membrane protein YjiH n=1 Tax=Caldalkalibacillus uzonensis TaxID=353224 RepID=A0ABU0CWE5_9BACI|nr:YjiH family protein [Caldalkalibacillus uzonensis]MDQ0339840.1 nucleoside recognition membrane protein YjiH [Caldalkalibacillus uzonensis]